MNQEPPSSPRPSGLPAMKRATARVTVLHHAVPGRIRLHIEGLRRKAGACRDLEQRMQAGAGIHRVTANQQTGNVLVLHDPRLPWETVVQLATMVTPPGWERDAAPSTEMPSPDRWWHRLFGHEERSHKSAPVLRASMILPAEVPAWHAMSSEEVLQRLQVSAEAGLRETDARERLQRFGANQLTRPRPPSYLRVLLDQFKSLPVLLLIGSAGLSFLSGGVADAAFILAVVGMNAFIGAETEMRAESIITSLADPGTPDAQVVRDGRVRWIRATEIVPGEIVLVSRGRFLSADSRLLSAENLTIDESALTGESLPVMKRAEPLPTQMQVPPDERRNMVFRGTVITGGSGRAVVVATGDQTEMGKIQSLMNQELRPATLLEQRLNKLGKQLALASCGIAGAVFLLGRMRGYRLLEMLKTSASLAIAAVPEGLPAIGTAAMAYSMTQLREREVLVRHRAALEALGDVHVLCLDKTGTITANRMSVMTVTAGRQRWRLHGDRFTPAGRTAASPEGTHLEELARVAVLCNEAQWKDDATETGWNGSATESALLQMAIHLKLDVERLRQGYSRRAVWGRSEMRLYMMTLHAGHGVQLMAVKGSPAEVLALCSRYASGGRSHTLTAGMRRRILAENQAMAGEGFRVLGFAHRELPEGEAAEPKDLTWLGLAGLADPPRAGMHEFVARLHRAGIRTMMITGDQNATASAIAAEIGLASDDFLRIRDFRTFLEDGGQTLQEAAQSTDVFARVSPSHKLQIVQALQHRAQVVAMTGDGINDGPALKAADVGIALGRAGTETAREVADVILLSDSPPILLAALRQGRSMQENIRKAIAYLTSTNLSETLLVLGCVAGGLGQPLTPRQLLWINLLTDIFPSLALAVEPPRAHLLRGPFGGSHHPLLDRQQALRLSGQAGVLSGSALVSYLYGLARYGPGEQASTLAFLSLTSAQLLHALTLRNPQQTAPFAGSSDSGSYVPWAILAGFAVEGVALGVPFLRGLLGISAAGWLDLGVCLVSAIGGLLVNGVRTISAKETAQSSFAASNVTPFSS